MTLSYTICINLYMPALFHLIVIREDSEAVIKVVVPDRWEVKCYFPTESRAETGTLELRYPPDFCVLADVVCVSTSCWLVYLPHMSSPSLPTWHSIVQGDRTLSEFAALDCRQGKFVICSHLQ